MFVKGERFDKLAEGYYTVRALMDMSEKSGVELPICSAVYKLLYENGDPKQTLNSLFERSLKQEF
jgi:glycerol-3-phosphate dehydrogenase (NAD(P)+)